MNIPLGQLARQFDAEAFDAAQGAFYGKAGDDFKDSGLFGIRVGCLGA